jgi:hypothetical protein
MFVLFFKLFDAGRPLAERKKVAAKSKRLFAATLLKML